MRQGVLYTGPAQSANSGSMRRTGGGQKSVKLLISLNSTPQRRLDVGFIPHATFRRRDSLSGLGSRKSPQCSAGFLEGVLTSPAFGCPKFSLWGRFLSGGVDLGDLVPTHRSL